MFWCVRVCVCVCVCCFLCVVGFYGGGGCLCVSCVEFCMLIVIDILIYN